MCRSTSGGPGSIPTISSTAAELVALAPNVILADLDAGSSCSTAGDPHGAHRIPDVADPVGGGLVGSLARPGGNMTGFIALEYTIGGKWLELLKEIDPRLTRAAVLRDPRHRPGTAY